MATYQLININLQDAVRSISTGVIQLPEFQRDFKWKQTEQASLLESIQKDYPAGSLLLLEVDPIAGSPFAIRPFDGVDPAGLERPRFLVLDGQQRLTTCFKAFSGRHKKWAVIDLRSLFDAWKASGEGRVDNFEDFIKFERRPKIHEDEILLAKNLLPFSFIRDRAAFRDRLATYRDGLLRHEDSKDFGAFVDRRLEGMLDVFFEYNFPAVELPHSLDLEAVANVFTKINTSGMRLSAFDLCVAALFPRNISLRTLWETARENVSIAAFEDDGTAVLQAIALIAGVSSKKAVLFESVKDVHINAHWASTVEAMKNALETLSAVGVTSAKSLPYDVAISVLTAASKAVPVGPNPNDRATRNDRTARFVLHTAFSQRYTEGVDIKRQDDFPKIVDYYRDGTNPAFLSETVAWDRELMLRLSNSGARFKALLAMLNSSGPRDLIVADQTVGLDNANAEQAEIHHVFPRAFLRSVGRTSDADRAFNMTFLTRSTNNFISDRAPSVYLRDAMNRMIENGITEEHARQRMLDILKSHLMDEACMTALLADDYDTFLDARSTVVRLHLQNRYGIPVSVIPETTADDLEVGEVVE